MNEANSPAWSEAIQDFFSDFKKTGHESSGTTTTTNNSDNKDGVGNKNDNPGDDDRVSTPSPSLSSSSPPLVAGADDIIGKKSWSPADKSEMENRYMGALVADIHNVLTHGGVFAYPADVKNANGKLRLLYEGNPMAMIVEQAGGVATTGFEPIMDVRPQSVHHRIPAFFGSPDDLLPLLNPRYLHSSVRRK